jgi:hypothetical protein
VSDYLRDRGTEKLSDAALHGLTSVGAGAVAVANPEPVSRYLSGALSAERGIRALGDLSQYKDFRDAAAGFDNTGLPGGPPKGDIMERKNGGRAAYKSGGTVGCAEVKKELPKISGKKATKMDGGAGGGLGRLEKINDYGKRSS